MTIPRCPHCNAQGQKTVAYEPLAAFALVYCKACGAIYGAVPCSQQMAGQPEMTRPAPAASAVTPLARLGNADLSIKQPLSLEGMKAEVRMARMYTPDSRYMRMFFDDDSPFCPTHKVKMREMVIPAGYFNAGRRLWVCPEFRDCQQWEVVE